jgi:hypothetical protein
MSRNIIGRLLSGNPQQRLRDPTRTKLRVRFRPWLEALENRLAPSVFTVNSTGDTGTGIGLNGDLRYCITKADTSAGTNTIKFDPTVFGSPKTITLTSLLPAITDNHLTITGPGAKLATVSGNHLFQVFDITGANASLSGLTIANGRATHGGGLVFSGAGTLALSNTVISGNSAFLGGGIYNQPGTITLTNSTLSGNHASYAGGGIQNNDGNGTVTLTNSTLSGNSATSFGGGINAGGTVKLTNSTLSGNTAGEAGGGISGVGIVTVTNSTLSGNTAPGGGIVHQGGGGIISRGTLTLTSSTLSGNTAKYGGGAILNYGTLTLTNGTLSGNSAFLGGGIYNNFGTTTLSNATLSGNSATYGGGIANRGALTLTNSTLSGNSAKVGGGINNYTGKVSHLNNTLIAGNTASGSDPDVRGGVIASSGFNLIGDGTGMFGISNGVNGNQIGTSASPIHPLLAKLGSYGGPTKTLPLLPGSPALDAGSNALDGGATTDQRGHPRIVNGTVDIGAFESQGFTVTVSAGNNQSTVINTPFASALAVTVSSSAGEPVAGGVVKFTAPSSGASAVLSATRVTLNGSRQGSVTATANNVAGSYQVVVSAGGHNAKANFNLTNLAHAANLSAVVASPTMLRAEACFSPTVSALDAFNNQVSANRGTVYFTSSGTAALLPADYTFTSADGRAAAAFDSLAANGFGGGNWTPSLLDAFFADEQRELGGAFIGRR